jgi:hypothetical protein
MDASCGCAAATADALAIVVNKKTLRAVMRPSYALRLKSL